MSGGARMAMGMMLLGLAGQACSASTSSSAPAPPAAFTQVLTFQAYDDTGLLPNLVRTATVSGSCQGGSAIHTGRADAWRCRSADTAFDPCFANPTGEELACVADPWAGEVTALRPAAPLGRAGSNRNDPGVPPWYLELDDGTRCGRAPATSTYRCLVGGDASEPDTSTPTWTVRRDRPVRDRVRTAWY